MKRRMEIRDCLCLRARMEARRLTQVYDRALGGTGLKVTQFQLLAAVDEAAPVGHGRLAELLGLDRTTLTRNLAVLERDGMVAVGAVEQDGRERRYALTTAGEEALARATPLWRRTQAALLRAGEGQ